MKGELVIAYALIGGIFLTGFVASFFGDAEFRRRRRLRRSMSRSRLNLGTAGTPNRRRS